jgi:hypothetical protein
MKRMITTILLIALCGYILPVMGQATRQDAIWARVAPGPIILDGVLNEPAWSQAETKVIDWATDNGIPGSGWKSESGWDPVDPTHATLKFLVVGNELYLGAVVQDRSIGGSEEFNRFDGILMALKDHANDFMPKPPAEYLYSWWHDENTDPQPPGQDPGFIGVWAELPHGSPRTPEQIANWDAVTVINGLSNDDATDDVGYTIEMRFNLTAMGYDVTQPEGAVIEWNISVYDTDWFWPIDIARFSSNRVWWQSPWGNDIWYNEVRVMVRPDVTVASGQVPLIQPEMTIPGLDESPVLDGEVNDAIWSDPSIYQIDIGWMDENLVATYDGVGPFRAGYFQPPVHGDQAFVADPPDANVKFFTRDDTLFVGFDVNDLLVQYHPNFDRWDGFLLTINDRQELHSDNVLLGKRLAFQVGASDSNGAAVAQDDLLSLVAAGRARVVTHMNPGTTVDTLGVVDAGYTAEIAIDLTALGYPSGLGDRAFFFGVTMLDGDSFANPITDSYGTRTWWYRQYENDCCAAWAHLEHSMTPVIDGGQRGTAYAFLRPSLNPSSRPLISYSMPDQNLVTLEVYDVRGRLVIRRPLGLTVAGDSRVPMFTQGEPAAGVYLFRLTIEDPQTGRLRDSLTGKMTLLK